MSKKGYKQTEEHKKNLSKAHKGKKFSEEHKKNLSKAKKGKKLSNEQKVNMKGHIPWNKGLTKETDIRIKKYTDNKIGIKRPDISGENCLMNRKGVKQKIINSLTGRKLSEEHKKNIGKSKKGNKNLKDYKFSKQSKEKMRNSHLGQKAWNKGKTGIFSKEVLKKLSIINSGKNCVF